MAWHAQLDLSYRRTPEGGTQLQHRHQGPLRVFKSLYPEGPAICHNVIVHPPGGLVQGDRLEVNVRVGSGAHALISTPGATRFYKSGGEAASQTVRLHLEPDARLEWVPLETIAYDRCQAINRLDMDLAAGAELMGWDVVCLGLPAASQPFTHGCFEQQMQWPDIWLERARIEAADHRLLHSPLGLDGHSTLATLFLACGTPLERVRREALLDACRHTIAQHPLAPRCGVTCPNDRMLVVRALSQQAEPVMQLWQSLWATLRAQAWHLPQEAPRIWRI